VQAGHSVWLVGLWLVLSMFISFAAYKLLRLYKERLDLQGRIDNLRPGWLFYRDPVYSVVWVRTVLKQAFVLTRRILMVPNVISERLDKVSPVIAALNQAGEAGEQLQNLPPLVRNRFKAIIARHVRTISDQNMDKAVADDARNALAALKGELVEGKWEARYRTEVERAIKVFLQDFSEEALISMAREHELDAQREQQLRAKRAILKERASVPATDVSDVMKLEQIYFKLSLLVERKNHPNEFKLLFEHLDDPGLDYTFFISDKQAWQRLKLAEDNEKLTIVAPAADGPEPLEAFRPLKFYVTTGDKSLDDSYLFNRGLRFQWTFRLLADQKKTNLSATDESKAKELEKTEPETFSPRVAQFAPSPGKWIVSAKIVCNLQEPGKEPFQDHAKPLSKDVHISKSSDSGRLKSIDRVETLTFLMAFLFALVTGVATFYYKNPTFGSVQDYITLFLWGATIDQTKNFLRDLQAPK
jgi:hypothetical protein